MALSPEWSDWSDCSVSCGTGTSSRKRLCDTDRCAGHTHEAVPCTEPSCNLIAKEPSVQPAALSLTESIQHKEHSHTRISQTFHSAAMITCEDEPCMNGGVCISGGARDGGAAERRHFIHFHCRCAHPYQGIMCDSVCDVETEVNGIVIGILSGILVLVLLGVAWSCTYSWRRRVKRWRKASDPNLSRKRGCWETLFGCKPRCSCKHTNSDSSCSHTDSYTLSGYSSGSHKCSVCTSSFDSVLSHNEPKPLALGRHQSSDFAGFADSGGPPLRDKSSHQTPGLTSRGSGLTSTAHQKDSSSRVTAGRKSSSIAESSEESLSEETSTNDNDNAAEHTSTQLSLAKNTTNNQSEPPACNQGLQSEPPKVSQAGAQSLSAQETVVTRSVKHPPRKCARKHLIIGKSRPRIGKARCDKHKPQQRAQESKDLGVQTGDTISPVEIAETPLASTIQKNLNEFIQSCDQLDSALPNSESSRIFRDPLLAERMREIRARVAAATLTSEMHQPPQECQQKSDISAQYPLVQEYMNRWRDGGRVDKDMGEVCQPASKSLPPRETSCGANKQPPSQPPAIPEGMQTLDRNPRTIRKLTVADARNWKPVLGNPVHAVWREVGSPPYPSAPAKLSDSLASAVESLKSFISNNETSPATGDAPNLV